jgi:hypothetical protein
MPTSHTDRLWELKLPPIAKSVAMHMAFEADTTGGVVRLSVEHIARVCGISRRDAQSTLRQLESLGVVRLVQAGDPSTRRPNEWRMGTPEEVSDIPRVVVPLSPAEVFA